MHLVDGAGNVNGLFVAEDVPSSRPPTEITAAIMNAIQLEIANVVQWAGLPLSKADNYQLQKALERSFARKSSTLHHVQDVWTIVDDLDALTALEGVPNNSEVIVTHYNGTHGMATWSGGQWTITALSVGVFDLYGTDVDQHGYYWFSGKWNLFDIQSVTVDDATEEQAGIIRRATLAETLAGTALDAAVTPWLLERFLKKLFVGMVAPFPCTVPPAGWIEANGAILSREVFADLWAFAEASGNLLESDDLWVEATKGKFSPGNGTTTFRVPDHRGEFLRMWDNSAGVDVGREIGTWQGDAIRNITGGIYGAYLRGGSTSGVFSYSQSSTRRGANSEDYMSNVYFDASYVVPTASENRPRSVAVLACIKY